MSKEIPTPYVWNYQPQAGTAAGASQDYSTRLHWLSAGKSMISKVNTICENRNSILLSKGMQQLARLNANPPFTNRSQSVTALKLPRYEILEQRMSNSGMQLAGGSLSLAEPLCKQPLAPDGSFQLGGGAKVFSREPQIMLLENNPVVEYSGGMGEKQFVKEFVPAVYFNPYSGLPASYPDQFISNYDAVTDSVDGYA